MRATAVQATYRQQKDNLCGPYWAARVLTDAGFTLWDGEPIDEDLIAMRAGTTLPEARTEPSVPPGATSQTDYRYPLPVASAQESGTSARGLLRAITSASAGSLHVIPIRGRWTADRVARLVAGAPPLEARLIANVRTGALWGSHPSAEDVLAELAGAEREGPAADWDAGHFIELAMLIRGPRGSLVAVRDSYPSLGRDGTYFQPPRAVAAALLRGDGREGGVLAVVPRARATEMMAVVSDRGLEVGVWNNGSRS
jgi:hypothetical protein